MHYKNGKNFGYGLQQLKAILMGITAFQNLKMVGFGVAEPIGSSGPKFSSEGKSTTFHHKANVALALTCAAQGHPRPLTR